MYVKQEWYDAHEYPTEGRLRCLPVCEKCGLRGWSIRLCDQSHCQCPPKTGHISCYGSPASGPEHFVEHLHWVSTCGFKAWTWLWDQRDPTDD